MAKAAEKKPATKFDIDKTIDKHNTKFKYVISRKMSEVPTAKEAGVYPTHSRWFNACTHIGGIPKQRITEIYGAHGDGKTSITLGTIAHNQKLDPNFRAGFIDQEWALDRSLCEIHGVDTSRLELGRPNSGEDGLQLIKEYVEEGFNMVVYDSVAAVVTEAELKGDIGDKHIAPGASIMSEALKQLTPIIGRSEHTAVIFVNQIRSKPMVMFGKNSDSAGGNALKFYASMRIECSRIRLISLDEKKVGHELRLRVEKNKLAPPYAACELSLYYMQGIDHAREMFQWLSVSGIMTKQSSFFIVGDKKFHGEEALLEEFLNPEFCDYVEKLILESDKT
jgi:recombination protein RecA